MFSNKHSKSPSKNSVGLRWGKHYLVYHTEKHLTLGVFSFKDALSSLIYGTYKPKISIDHFILVLTFIKIQVNK